MRWEDERYIRFYTRNKPEWLALSWQARGLFGLIMRAVDRAGFLEVGKLGLKGVAVAVQAPWTEIEGPLGELLVDGCVKFDETARVILLPNFIEAQECAASDKARKRASRERARDLFGGTTDAAERARSVTNHDDMESGNVTEGHGADVTTDGSILPGHDESQPVTPYRAVPFRTEPNPTHPATEPPSSGAIMAAQPVQPEERVGSPSAEGSKPFKLDRSTVLLEQSVWMATYARVVEEVRGGEPFTFDKRKVGVLVDVIQTHCRGEDRKNIDGWIARDVADFVRAVIALNQDPMRFWSAFGPDGLLKWHNGQRPGCVPPASASSAPRLARTTPREPEEPVVTGEEKNQQFAQLMASLSNFGRGGHV